MSSVNDSVVTWLPFLSEGRRSKSVYIYIRCIVIRITNGETALRS